MRFTALLMMLVSQSHGFELSYFDSTPNPRFESAWRAVEVPKVKVHDPCFILQKVSNFCHLDLKMEECNAKDKK